MSTETRILFAKPAITLDAQVELLAERGMAIPHVARAKRYLQFLGYYRLSGYWRYYCDASRERFREGTTFQAVLDLYIFDRRMRVLLLDSLDRIEIAIKAEISQSVALTKGPFWLCDTANFDYGCHAGIEAEIRDAIGAPGTNHQHVFIKHFYRKYADPYPPCWMIMETLSFGTVSRIYKLLKGALRIPVADAFELQHGVLESWLHALAFGRNVCAHNCRVWNRSFTIKPKIPKKYRSDWPTDAQDKLYVLCCLIHHMMKIIADDSDWSSRLRQLIQARPGVPLSAMGFPADWEETDFWDFPAS